MMSSYSVQYTEAYKDIIGDVDVCPVVKYLSVLTATYTDKIQRFKPYLCFILLLNKNHIYIYMY